MRGRSILALVLTGFVLMTTGVIYRRSYGTLQGRIQSQLEARRATLEAERAKLDGDIRDAASGARLAKIAQERLNMRIPSDSQVFVVPRPARKAP